jgi:Ca2+-binding EF-hand superfamily protein
MEYEIDKANDIMPNPMKTIYPLIILLAFCITVTAQSQDTEKTMEKAAREAYKQLLTETDKNKDGKISKTEFYAIWKDKKMAEEKFTYWDTNKDGYITEEEYVKAVLDIGKKKK